MMAAVDSLTRRRKAGHGARAAAAARAVSAGARKSGILLRKHHTETSP